MTTKKSFNDRKTKLGKCMTKIEALVKTAQSVDGKIKYREIWRIVGDISKEQRRQNLQRELTRQGSVWLRGCG